MNTKEELENNLRTLDGLYMFAIQTNKDKLELAKYACKINNISLLKYVIEIKGLDPFINDQILLVYASTGITKMEIIKYLLSFGLSIDKNRKDIMLAAAAGHHEFSNTYTNLNFYINIGVYYDDVEVLCSACVNGSLSNVKTCLVNYMLDESADRQITSDAPGIIHTDLDSIDVMLIEMLFNTKLTNDIRLSIFKHIYGTYKNKITDHEDLLCSLIATDSIKEFKYMMGIDLFLKHEYEDLLKREVIDNPNSVKVVEFINNTFSFKSTAIVSLKKILKL